ncbi:MAG TPA: glycosyltransferase [Chthoniobacterales bacterium]
MNVVILGLSITSAWGNGHTVTFRALCKALTARGHGVLFLERDTPWYRPFRDELSPAYGRVELYDDLASLFDRHAGDLSQADCVIQGSYVPEGVNVAKGVARAAVQACRIFYDLDTPVTLAKLEAHDYEYLSPEVIPTFDFYLSFAGGAVLDKLAKRFGVRNPVPFWCTVDPALHIPVPAELRWELGYLGTFSADRQAKLETLLFIPAGTLADRRFAVAGPLYPERTLWPANVDRIEHVSPAEHGRFYASQRFTLNLTRQAMVTNGYSPSTRLFEAAACGTAIISDRWQGIDQFLEPGLEVIIVDSGAEVVEILRGYPESDRQALSARARERILAGHTAEQRVLLLERLLGSRHEPDS